MKLALKESILETKSLLPKNENAAMRFLEEICTGAFVSDEGLIETKSLKAKAEILPLIAQGLDVDIRGLGESEARAILSQAFLLHKNAGTPYALKKALNAVFENIIIKEWFSYGGNPYTFRVKVSSGTKGFNQKELELLDVLIEEYKNVRSILEAVEIELLNKSISYNGSVSVSGESITVLPYQETQRESITQSHFGCGVFICEIEKRELDMKGAY